MSRHQIKHRLYPFFHPRSIALVGASENKTIIRGRLVAAIVHGGYAGVLYPVTRSSKQILGLKCYPNVASIPDVPDLAVIMVPADVVAQLLEECAKKGVRAAVIVSSGFDEQGGEQASSRQADVQRIAQTHSMVVCGPNSEGFYNPSASLTATFSPALLGRGPSSALSRPGVGIVSQSGGVGFAIYNRGLERGLQASHVVSTGNEVDLDATEIVDYLLEDDATSVITLFIEGLKRVSGFLDVAKRANTLHKPMVVSKVGRSPAGRRASLSHTATLVGAYNVYESVLKNHGITLVDSLDQLVDVSHAFARFIERPAKGRRVAVLTASGGAGIWMADTCIEHGLEVAELDAATQCALGAMMPAYGSAVNPVDVTAQGVVMFGFSEPLRVLLDSPCVDMVIVVTSAIVPELIRNDADALGVVVQSSDKPVLFCAYTTLHPEVIQNITSVGLPITNSLSNAALAMSRWADYSDYLAKPVLQSSSSNAVCDPLIVEKLAGKPAVLCEYQAREILSATGMALGPSWLATTADEAVQAFQNAHGPVALKLQSSQLIHKSDVGGVLLGLADAQTVEKGFHAVMRAAPAAIDGVLVQPMAPPGSEVIVGVKRDDDFGPIVMLGLGGIWVEVLADVQIAQVPVTQAQVRSLFERLKAKSLLLGGRGRRVADLEALFEFVERLSQFAHTYQDHISEIELNPIIVHPQGQGLTIVDALMIKRTH